MLAECPTSRMPYTSFSAMKSVTHYGRTSGLGRFTVKNDFGDIRKLNIFEIDVDYDLFNDGTLKLVKSPGHSPGLQVLLLDLPNRGRICLAADTGHQRDGFENMVPMPWDWSASGMTLTRQRIKQLERSGVPFFVATMAPISQNCHRTENTGTNLLFDK